jgi:flagellar biosynthesis/type III secretory pathway protein FliH
VPRARDLLARFRPVGAPGAAAPAGVPADRGAERERELQPVFAELAATEEEAARIRAAATTDAAARTSAATEQAQAIVESARRDAEAHRAEAAAAVLRQVEQSTSATRAAARHEAEEIAARARERLPDLVARLVDGILSDEPIGVR